MNKKSNIPIKKNKRLIEAVRAEPSLWDTKNELYKNVPLQKKIWQKIAKETDFGNGLEAKSQWKKLRDVYRYSLKKKYIRDPKKPWKYSNEMAFLKPVMFYSKPKIALELGVAKGNDVPSEDEAHYVDTDVNIKVEPEYTEETEAVIEIEKNQTENDEVNSINGILDEPSDPLKKFFLSMYSSTKLLPKRYQLKIKRRIFDAVVEAEEAYFDK